jgi:phytoene dehydrogenase-like protein
MGFDVVVVGAGHNGLACACYLAKAGATVVVLETRDVVGGGCATKEVAAPGFRHNFHSNFHGIIHMGPVYRDLELERYGARYVWPEHQFAHVFPDGRALVWSRDIERTVSSVARFSKRDAATVRDLTRTYMQLLDEALVPAMFAPPGPPSADWAGLEAMPGGLELARHFLTSPNHLARSLFESPEVQTWIGFWVAQLAGTGDVFGLGGNYPVMLAGSTAPHGWAICEGGLVRLAEAMAAFLADHGGEVRTGATVRQIVVDDGRATAVVLDDASSIPVEGIVASNLDPRHTFLELVGEQDLPPEFRPLVARWRYDVMSMFCCYLALERPVRWHAAAFEPDVQRCFAVSMCETLDVLDDNASDCRLGVPPRRPGLFTVHPSLFEPSLCPAGKEACFVEQIAPYELRDGGHEAWADVKDEYADVVLSRWRDYASGVEPADVVGRYVSSPIDIEAVMPSMKHGDWNHGEMTQDQLGVFRPWHEYGPYRTAFENVYLCGASTHPGGSIGGACGYNAATAIADDLGLDAWWRP